MDISGISHLLYQNKLHQIRYTSDAPAWIESTAESMQTTTE